MCLTHYVAEQLGFFHPERLAAHLVGAAASTDNIRANYSAPLLGMMKGLSQLTDFGNIYIVEKELPFAQPWLSGLARIRIHG